MSFHTIEDSAVYFLRLPHLLPVFLVPIVGFYSFLAVWLVRKLRSSWTKT